MKIIKLVLLSIAVFCAAALIAFYMRGGDLLLKYLADSVGVELLYENRCTFRDAFIFKKTEVKNLKLRIPEADAAIKCPAAHIEFDYSDTRAKGAIGLRCYLNNPILEVDERYLKANELSMLDVVPGAIFPILWGEVLSNYESIHCDISLYGDTIEIHHLMVISDSMIINARGLGDKKGSLDGSIKFFFKPKFVQMLPEEVRNLLKNEPNGWAVFNINIKTNVKDEFLKIESDDFKLVIGDENQLL